MSVYYVSTTGVDGAGVNGSITTPWKTLPYAVTRIVGGDTIYLRGGTHTFGTIGTGSDQQTGKIPSGPNAANPTKILGYPAETAIWRPPAGLNTYLAIIGTFTVMEGNIWFGDFEIDLINRTVIKNPGFLCRYHQDVTFDNMTFKNNDRGYGFIHTGDQSAAMMSYRLTIKNCTFSEWSLSGENDPLVGHGVYLQKVEDLHVHDCVFTRVSAAAQALASISNQAIHCYTDKVPYYFSTGIIERNYIKSYDGGITIGRTTGMIIRNNVVVTDRRAPLAVGYGAISPVVDNNTFYGGAGLQRGAINLVEWGAVSGAVFQNNIAWNGGTFAVRVNYTASNPSVWKKNLLQTDIGGVGEATADRTTTINYIGNPPYDPKFLTIPGSFTGAFDLQPGAGSAALNAGMNLSASFTDDVDKKVRAADAFDIGAHEASTPPDPPNPTVSTVNVAAVYPPIATISGLTPATFRFTRTGGDTSGSLAVNYTVTGTATGGVHYTALSGVATIGAGNAYVDVTVQPLAGSGLQSDATVIVTIDADAAYVVGSFDNATITIRPALTEAPGFLPNPGHRSVRRAP